MNDENALCENGGVNPSAEPTNETPESEQLLFSPPRTHETFPVSASVLAAVCLVLGYVFVKLVLSGSIENNFAFGTMTSIVNYAFCAVLLIYFRREKVKITKTSFALFCEIIVFNALFFISSADFIEFLNECFVITLILYWAYATAHGTGFFSERYFPENIASLFGVPFGSFGRCFPALFYPLRNRKAGSTVRYITAGLLCAIPLSVIVGSLLISSDSGFESLFDGLFSGFFDDLFMRLVRIALAAFVGCYLFGAVWGNLRKESASSSAERDMSGGVQPLALYAFVTPVCVLYAMYFCVQAQYFLGGFVRRLPANFSYSEYARRGFFELLAIALINLGIIIVIRAVAKREDNIPAKGIRFFNILVSAFTLLIIATALSKMVMYINRFGLTQLRVYTSWFMLLLALIFMAVIIKQIIGKFPFFKVVFAAFTVMFGFLCFGDVDGRIAEYNVNAYISGELETLDVDMLYNLSDSSVKYVLPVLEYSDCNEYIRKAAEKYIVYTKDAIENENPLYISISTVLALNGN